MSLLSKYKGHQKASFITLFFKKKGETGGGHLSKGECVVSHNGGLTSTRELNTFLKVMKMAQVRERMVPRKSKSGGMDLEDGYTRGPQ